MRLHDVGSITGEPQAGRLLFFAEPIPYRDIWQLQQSVHADRRRNACSDTLILLQHQAVYTMGRSTIAAHIPQGEDVLLRSGAAVETVNRGGSVTYHGPGQLVGYPIMRFPRVASGPRAYVSLLEEVVIRTLSGWGIEGHRVEKTPGVFVSHGGREFKIASIGIRADRGVTLHGFSINVDLDLSPFALIVPCGLHGVEVTSMRHLCGGSVPLSDVASVLSLRFAELFRLSWHADKRVALDPLHEQRFSPEATEVS